MASFSSFAVKHRLQENSKLLKLDKLIDWSRFESLLRGIHKNDIDSKGGRRCYDKICMLKLVLLGQWNSLSDEELEYAVRVRLDFISFCGFDIEDKVPDHSTICRFRNKLIEIDLIDKILTEVNNQLSENHLKVAKANLAVIDATLIESNSRPNRTKTIEEHIIKDREEVTSTDTNAGTESESEFTMEESDSSDPDAKWLQKGNKYHFGYKSFATTDEEGYICKTKTLPANKSEINQMSDMVIDSREFSGDKGYDSKSNREFLRNRGIKTRLMYKKPKGKPMTKWQKRFNKAVSKRRFIVEQSFGTLKRRFKFNKASYFTTKKVNAQFTLKAICLNLLKAVNKIKAFIPPEKLELG
jgi:IS5 family transposase